MSAAESFRQRLQGAWQAPFFQTIDDQVYTYGDTWCTALAICRSWRAQGLEAGSVIALRSGNCFDLPCFYLACLAGGYIACPVVPGLHENTIRQNLETVNPALVLERLNAGIVRADCAPESESLAAIDENRAFLIMFSSGSTGRNKAICHRFESVAGSARAFAKQSGFDENTRLYHVLPMTYMAGFLNAMLAVMMAGGKVIEGPQFSMQTVADFWSRPLATDANILSMIPPLAAAVCRMTRDPEKIKQVGRQFEIVQCTSQSIQADLRQRFLEKFNLPLRDCYGMTELGGPLSIQSAADALALNDFSDPLPGLEIEIRDGGELWIHSPWTMLGYLDDGNLTSPVDDRGFLDTGDLAERENSRIRVTGRVKDIVIRGGINTSPARIESMMSTMPAISEVAVVGLPHAFWGEELVACVVPTADKPAPQDTGAILQWCRSHLDSHEVPDRIVYMTALPRSFIGKVLKRNLVTQLNQATAK